MTYSTNENVVDPACHQWIVPDFTAITTPTDVVAASVMLKSSLQNYKSISASVVGSTFQLLREKDQHQTGNAKALKDESPDHPESDWSCVAHRSGLTYLSGWVTVL